MRHRIMDILLVASPYDTFLLEEAGQLAERLLGEFRNLDLHYGPGLTGVSTGAEALALAREPGRFNLVISSLRLSDMNGLELAQRLKAEGVDIPVILLAYDHDELLDFTARNDLRAVERAFLWQGDARIVLAIVKCVEDRLNVAHDVRVGGVQVILLVEDNVRFYSSFLPVLYAELLNQSQQLLSEGANLSHKITRMRARPKILLCSSYEEAAEAFDAYQDDVLGVISDIEFPRGGQKDPDAGLEFARYVRSAVADVPVILQSSRPDLGPRAREMGADFLLKGSPLLLSELRRVMKEYFGFGDFVFRLLDGSEVARARDLRTLEEKLASVPAESVAFHAERNHFSKWLKARTEFSLAHAVRSGKITDFPTADGLRRSLIESIEKYRREQSQAVVADFDRDSFDGSGGFHRVGGGSLGGKARGLAFVRQLLAETRSGDRFEGVHVSVPPALVLATDVFDSFLDQAGLRQFAIHCQDDAELERRFTSAPFPDEVRRDLRVFLGRERHPLAVRSSSILEDSRYQPFSGVYETFMLPNDDRDDAERLDRLLRAVKRVYASTFSSRAKAYLRATPYRLEEEKMAVIVQRIVGAVHGDHFYPDFAGVAWCSSRRSPTCSTTRSGSSGRSTWGPGPTSGRRSWSSSRPRSTAPSRRSPPPTRPRTMRSTTGWAARACASSASRRS
jgi:CheY-like chemotaxis protein